jgi:hypothetical protein
MASPIGNNAAAISTELERVRAKLPELFAVDDTIFNLILARTKRDEVSFRPERIPFQVSNGVAGQVVSLDGGDMGVGGGPQTTYGSLAPVQFDWIIQWTKQAEIGTDSSEKSTKKYAQIILKAHMKAAQNDLGALIAYGDGANTIGIATAASALSGDGVNYAVAVDNATRFRQGAQYDYYNSGVGGGKSGMLLVTGIDYVNKLLYLGTAAPSPTVSSGAAILFYNSAGTAGAGINGFTALQSYSTTGSYMGVTKTSFPGNFVTPSVNAGSTLLTPQIARLILNYLYIVSNIEEDGDMSDYLFHMGVDQAASWEDTGIVITQIMQTGADATGRDTLAKTPPQTIGGVKLRKSRMALPGRIDLLDLGTWFCAQVQELDFYSAGDQEVFWPYGSSGGIAAAYLKYLIWVGNVGCDNPKRNGVIYNLTVPTGY